MNSLPRVIFRRAMSTVRTGSNKPTGDISSVFPSLSGKKPEPLPDRFRDLKLQRIQGREDALKQSWVRLLASLKDEIKEIKARGTEVSIVLSESVPSYIDGQKVIPIVEFSDVASGQVKDNVINEIRHRGSAVIRNVLPRQSALDLKTQAREYIAANPGVKAFPPDDPSVFEMFWSPSQTAARAHPNVLATQQFLASLWHSSDPKSELSTTYPLTYADRLRIRRPGDAKFALGPHTDGGSLERWEDPEYSKVYQSILDGEWEKYDAMDARHRINAHMDLYNSQGGCSAFRFFQGWLSMSSTGPGEGTLRLCPLLKHATAYLILRPFFDSTSGSLNLDSSFPGSVPGAGQEYSPETHPHLELESSMVSVPKVEPGDYVAWHCDTIHAVDKEHNGHGDSSVLYIPACAMTPRNIEFIKKQRVAALAYSPPQDFPGAGGPGELGFKGAVDWDQVPEDGLRALGLGSSGWERRPDMSEGEISVIENANRVLFTSASA